MGVDLRQLLIAKQKTLAAGLEVGREVFEHPGAKGDVSEFDWRGALSEFLPKRYAVSKAFVLDSKGEVSDQIDLVIHDAHYCPLLFEQGEQRYIPAESVYAVFEIKQELTSEAVPYAIAKAASVRRLYRTSLPIIHAGGEYTAREPFEILAGILALRSSWSPAFGDSFESSLDDGDDRGRLDLGCALLHGAFDIRYEEDGRTITASEPRPASCISSSTSSGGSSSSAPCRRSTSRSTRGTLKPMKVEAKRAEARGCPQRQSAPSTTHSTGTLGSLMGAWRPPRTRKAGTPGPFGWLAAWAVPARVKTCTTVRRGGVANLRANAPRRRGLRAWIGGDYSFRWRSSGDIATIMGDP